MSEEHTTDIQVLKALFAEARKSQEQEFKRLNDQLQHMSTTLQGIQEQNFPSRINAIEEWRRNLVRNILAWISLGTAAVGSIAWIVKQVIASSGAP